VLLRVNRGLIGFGRAAMVNARNEARMPGSHRAWVRVRLRTGWPKRISQPN
jgi:hypothetical protein